MRYHSIALVLILLANLLLIGCDPAPPAGAFPERVGNFERMQNVASFRESDYILHRGDYGHKDPHMHSIWRDISYDLRVYPSATQAEAALQAKSQDTSNEYERVTWEDRLNESGEKVGKMLVVSTVREEGNSVMGYCNVIYTQGSYYVYLYSHQPSCEPAKKFQQGLSF